MSNNENNQKPVVMLPYHDINSPFSVGELESFAEYIARDPDKFPELILGAFVLIQDNDANAEKIWIVGRVVELKAVSPFNPKRQTALYAENEDDDPAVSLLDVTGPHTHQPMIARIRLERQMVSNEGKSGFISFPVQRPPSAHSRMRFPAIENEENAGVPSLHEMLGIQQEGIILGYVGQGNEPFQQGQEKKLLPYKWNVAKLDNKHMFIIGESGSGKTVLLKNIAYQLSQKEKPRILMTDVQGDIAQMLTPDLEGITLSSQKRWKTKSDSSNCEQSIKKVFGKMRLVVPMTKREKSDRLKALINMAKQDHEVCEISLRLQDLSAPSDVEYLFRVTSEQVAILLDKIAEYCEKPYKKKVSPQPASIKNLKKCIDKKLKENKEEAKIEVGDTFFYTSTFYAAQRALTSLENFFDFSSSSMAEKQNPLDNALNFDGTTILYLDDLDQDERIMWEMQLVNWLYENRRKIGNAFIFFDEAHQIIPAKPPAMGANSAAIFVRLRRNFDLLAREGRKFGINLVLSTQSPQDLHPIVPEQCPTKIVMKINPRNAAYVSLDKELIGIAARFDAGQFYITSPFNGTPDWVRVYSDTPPLPHMSMSEYGKKLDNVVKS